MESNCCDGDHGNAPSLADLHSMKIPLKVYEFPNDPMKIPFMVS